MCEDHRHWGDVVMRGPLQRLEETLIEDGHLPGDRGDRFEPFDRIVARAHHPSPHTAARQRHTDDRSHREGIRQMLRDGIPEPAIDSEGRNVGDDAGGRRVTQRPAAVRMSSTLLSCSHANPGRPKWP